MNPEQIAGLLEREMGLAVDAKLAAGLGRYLDLLVRWNARMNLTAIRSEEQIVLRHFGESLQCAQALPLRSGSMLDYGSGAGFPGLVCSLAHPLMEVLVAESQGKKASFLQEACRSLPCRAGVYAGRVEDLGAERRFDIVTMRAVDRMNDAMQEAVRRVKSGGWLAVMTTRGALERSPFITAPLEWTSVLPVRGTQSGVTALGQVL